MSHPRRLVDLMKYALSFIAALFSYQCEGESLMADDSIFSFVPCRSMSNL